ncbi:MAG TPA: hypothetical protein PLB62_11760, partial [Candidatus Sumerlaeota bacterium]|nr:hypothetical protein [Candidatus Sumerlaeota bacterium]
MPRRICVIVCIIMLSLATAVSASGPILIDHTALGSGIISGQKGLSADTSTTTPTPTVTPTPTYTATPTPTATPVPITRGEIQDYLLSRRTIPEGDGS